MMLSAIGTLYAKPVLALEPPLSVSVQLLPEQVGPHRYDHTSGCFSTSRASEAARPRAIARLRRLPMVGKDLLYLKKEHCLTMKH